MKKLVSLLLALLMVLSCAQAESPSPIAMYRLPDGAEIRYLTDTADWLPPEGYEGLYRLMQTASFYSDVYLARMKNGKALCSISCTFANREWQHDEG